MSASSKHAQGGGASRWRNPVGFLAAVLIVLGTVIFASGSSSLAAGSDPVTFSVVGGSSQEVDFTLASSYANQVLVQYGKDNGGGTFSSTSGSVQLNPGQTKLTLQDDCNVAFNVSDNNKIVQSGGSFTVPANCDQNQAPVANNDSATTPENTAVTLDVLANDTDADNDSLSVASVTNPTHGTATIVSNKVKYTPASGYHGTDTFTYKASDGTSDSNAATVTVTVTKVTPKCTNATKGNMGATSSGTTASVNPTVDVCATTLYWQEYVVPSTWDGNGFDASAYTPPQQRVEVDSKTVQGAGKVSFSVALDTTTDQYTWQGGCYVNRQIDLNDVSQTSIDASGSHGTLYTYVLKRFKVSDNVCGYVAPLPKDASGDFTLTGVCGLGNDTVNATAVNAVAGEPVWDGTKVSVTFTANTGHLFPNGQDTLTVTKDEVDTTACPTVQTVTPVPPTQILGNCTDHNSYVNVPTTTGVLYLLNDKDVSGQTITLPIYSNPISIQPVAAQGYQLDKDYQPYVFNNNLEIGSCSVPPPIDKIVVKATGFVLGGNCPTLVDTIGASTDTSKVTLVYYLDGKQVSPFKYVSPGHEGKIVAVVKHTIVNTVLPNGKTTMQLVDDKNTNNVATCNTSTTPNHRPQAAGADLPYVPASQSSNTGITLLGIALLTVLSALGLLTWRRHATAGKP